MKKLMDLHSHSTYSDGTSTPEELVSLAKKIDLSAIALTDHDTIDGVGEFLELCKEHDIEGITGVEISTLHTIESGIELHILSLNFPYPNDRLKIELETFKNLRESRNEKMADNFCKLGIPITMEELRGESESQVITRAHFANLLIEKGFAKDKKEVFERHLAKDSPAYVEKTMPSSKTVIDLIHSTGGVAVIAHPTLYKLNLEEMEDLCKILKGLGLDGIEVSHSTYTKSQEKYIKDMAERLDLLPCGGSDFHGENKPMVQLGKGKGNQAIPYEYLDAIKERAKKYS